MCSLFLYRTLNTHLTRGTQTFNTCVRVYFNYLHFNGVSVKTSTWNRRVWYLPIRVLGQYTVNILLSLVRNYSISSIKRAFIVKLSLVYASYGWWTTWHSLRYRSLRWAENEWHGKMRFSILGGEGRALCVHLWGGVHRRGRLRISLMRRESNLLQHCRLVM